MLAANYQVMLNLVGLLLGLIVTRFKSKVRHEADILVLRHQIGILRLSVPIIVSARDAMKACLLSVPKMPSDLTQ